MKKKNWIDKYSYKIGLSLLIIALSLFIFFIVNEFQDYKTLEERKCLNSFIVQYCALNDCIVMEEVGGMTNAGILDKKTREYKYILNIPEEKEICKERSR